MVEDAPSSQLATVNSKRLCTGAMVKAVEQEILKSKRYSSETGFSTSRGSFLGLNNDSSGAAGASDGGFGFDAPAGHLHPCGDLVLGELIGAGGFGMVWKGSWKKVTAAVKVGGRWLMRGRRLVAGLRVWNRAIRAGGWGLAYAFSATTTTTRN
jgi:hypothetical protein